MRIWLRSHFRCLQSSSMEQGYQLLWATPKLWRLEPNCSDTSRMERIFGTANGRLQCCGKHSAGFQTPLINCVSEMQIFRCAGKHLFWKYLSIRDEQQGFIHRKMKTFGSQNIFSRKLFSGTLCLFCTMRNVQEFWIPGNIRWIILHSQQIGSINSEDRLT